jgi:hypothetical protein
MAAQSTYTPIATITANGSTRDIIFSNIPQTYTDLRVSIYSRSNYGSTEDSIAFYFNSYNSPSVVHSQTQLYGNGSSAYSSRATGQNIWILGNTPAATTTSGIFGAATLDILNYANTSTYKTGIARTADDLNGSGQTQLTVGLWRSTSAITQIDFFPLNASTVWVSGSIFTLYGITAA